MSLEDEIVSQQEYAKMLEQYLKVKCLFPSKVTRADITGGTNASSSVMFNGRCMLEIDSKGINSSDNFKSPVDESSISQQLPTLNNIKEDVIIRSYTEQHLRKLVLPMLVLCSDDSIDIAYQSIKSLLSKLYKRQLPYFDTLHAGDISTKDMINLASKGSYSLHPGLCSIYGCLQLDSKDVILLHQYTKHTVLSISRFHARTTLSSPTLQRCGGIGSRDLRKRFILYQLLQAVAFVHAQGLCVDKITPGNLMLDDDMWLSLPVGITDKTYLASILNDKNVKLNDASSSNINDYIMQVDKPIDYYEPLTIQWITRKISNFEYLMAVNHAAGRGMIDPLYHPILPWVTDFSCEDPVNGRMGLRDLTKTKFRLSKGDSQLETTYKHSDPPHHVPESLSELTYYIYMARRTPMQVLRRVVRDVFVPEHYPHSVARMYDWTPDECIPEFYSDPSVFLSIHESVGLNNLELPTFAPTPVQFIKYHRRILESDAVSSVLHIWLNLTFGCYLHDQAAIDNMNVPLSHTLSANERAGDSPNLDKHPGFVILFTESHPPRQSMQAEKLLDELQMNSSGTTYTRNANEILLIDASDNMKATKLNGDSNHLLNSTSINLQAVSSNPSHSNTIDRLMSSLSSGSATNVSKRQSTPSLNKPFITDASLSKLKESRNITLNSSMKSMCQHLMSNLDGETVVHRFVTRFGSYLQPCYHYDSTNATALSTSSSSSSSESSRALIDGEFVSALLQLISDKSQHGSALPSQHRGILEKMQCDDMYSVGCVIAELFLGQPLLGVNDLLDCNIDSVGIIKTIYRKTIDLPLIIRRLVVSLVVPGLMDAKPKALEVLQACTKPDFDSWTSVNYGNEQVGGARAEYVDFTSINTDLQPTSPLTPSSPPALTNIMSPVENATVDLLYSHCSSLFPSYFNQIYQFVGHLKLCHNGLDKFIILIKNISLLQHMPLEGLTLALPHILAVVCDPRPFQNDNHNCQDVKYDRTRKKVIAKYPIIIDILGARLGMEGTEKLLVAKVTTFLNNLMSTEMLCDILSSSLWSVLIIRAGVRVFLQHFLSMLLTYLVSGTLYTVSRTILHDSSPLWQSLEWNVSGKEWLQACPLHEIRNVQSETVQTIKNLANPDLLGYGLCTRYVLPALMCLVGVPQLAVAAYDINNMSLDSGGDDKFIYEYIADKCVYDPKNMYSVQAVVNLCFQIGEKATAEVVLVKIFNYLLPQMELDLRLSPTAATIAALMELILLLNGILPSLTPDVIRFYFLQQGTDKTTSSLPKLLLSLPLPLWTTFDDPSSLDKEDLMKKRDYDTYINNYRLYCLHLELCKLIVSTSMITGPSVCKACVLPVVDEFFRVFIDTYCNVPIESNMMAKAFELGASLFLPLVQLTGPEAFSTSVPNVNPRLEMWLTSIGDPNIPKKSPPLPPNILYQVVTDTGEQLASEKKKAGIGRWISDTTKWITSASKATNNDSSSSSNVASIKKRSSIPSSKSTSSSSTVTKTDMLIDYDHLSPLTERAIILSNNPNPSATPFASVISPTLGMELSSLITPRNIFPPATPSNLFAHLDAIDESPSAIADAALGNITDDSASADELDNDAVGDDEGYKCNVEAIVTTAVSSDSGKSIVELAIAGNTDNLYYADSEEQSLEVDRKSMPSAKYRRMLSIAKTRSSEVSRNAIARVSIRAVKSNASSSSSDVLHDDDDEEAHRENNYSDQAWLLAGKGRWSVSADVSRLRRESAHITTTATATAVSTGKNLLSKFIYPTRHNDSSTPAAQVSMTAPRIAVDVASEAGGIFSLSMHNTTTIALEKQQPAVSSEIKLMLVNPNESILLTSSESGVSLWSLNTHPMGYPMSTYSAHTSPPYCAAFMRNGIHVASCDGTINVWDVEYSRTMSYLKAPAGTNKSAPHYSFMKAISPRHGFNPSLNNYGDNQLIACHSTTLSFHDFRDSSRVINKPVARWMLPSAVPSSSQSFMSSSVEQAMITYATSSENYIYAGSNYGTVWMLDRRMGKLLQTLQAHDSSIVNISELGDDTFLTVSNGAAFVWDINSSSNSSSYLKNNAYSSNSNRGMYHDDMRKMMVIKNIPETGMTSNTVFMHTFDQMHGSPSGITQDLNSSAPLNVLYCVSGHKLFAGKMPCKDKSFYNSSIQSYAKECTGVSNTDSVIDEMKLTTTHFTDRSGVKLSKQKLNITSCALLPLRKLLVVGTSDGLMRIVQ